MIKCSTTKGRWDGEERWDGEGRLDGEGRGRRGRKYISFQDNLWFLCIQFSPRLCFCFQLNLGLCCHISIHQFPLADVLTSHYWRTCNAREFVSVQRTIDNGEENEKYLQLHIHIHKFQIDFQQSYTTS